MRSISKWLLCAFASAAAIFAQVGAPLTITSTSPLPNATQQSPYEFTFVAQNGFGALTWSLTGGTAKVKESLTFAGVFNQSAGAIVTVAAKDTLTISGAASLGGPRSVGYTGGVLP